MKKEEKKDNTQKARKGKEQGIEYFQDPKNYVNRELSCWSLTAVYWRKPEIRPTHSLTV